MKTQNVVVDIGNLKASDIFFVQGEQGREITFKVINSLLENFVNLAEYTATIHILKSDGNFTIDTMTIDSAKGECYYTLTENDCACGGRGFYDLSFSKNDELIYTAHGDFVGDFRSVNDDSVASVSSAYGVTFPEGFQQKLIAGDKIHISDENVISAEGETYTAGDNINISDNNVISATDTKYSAGDNIEINSNNTINCTIGVNVDLLYTNSSGEVEDIILTDNKKFTDYDFIIFDVAENSNTYYSMTSLFIKQQIIDCINNNAKMCLVYLLANYHIYCNAISDSKLELTDTINMHVRKVYGIKLS